MRKIGGRSREGKSSLSDKSGRRSERQSEGVKLLLQGKVLFHTIKLEDFRGYFGVRMAKKRCSITLKMNNPGKVIDEKN